MVEYSKPWLSINGQIQRLRDRGVDIGDDEDATQLLRAIGYYRLTGYLYPFRQSENYRSESGEQRSRILSHYRPGTSLAHANRLVDFDRRLRLLVLDGVERIEVALRMQIGYVLGHRSPFAHLLDTTFVTSFTQRSIDPATGEPRSRHTDWLQRVDARRRGSDEAFVAHFRDKYDDAMPIWALTEILELGHLARLFAGLSNDLATTIAHEFDVPTKRLMASWLASLNYVRNVSAHHARLYNRKLVAAPQRPAPGIVPLLDHLRDDQRPKAVFGTYNSLAVIAYLLGTIDGHSGWPERMANHLLSFPEQDGFTIATMGAPAGWSSLQLWT